MNTGKVISTISFNTEPFLQTVLDDLIKADIIEFYAYIRHTAEPEETKDEVLKDHLHIFLTPCKRVDTSKLKKLFDEPTNENSIPLKCLPFKLSKFTDWYLYALHNPIYLASKGMVRKYSYSIENIWTNDTDLLRTYINDVNITNYNVYFEISLYQDKGLSFHQYCISKNLNPIKIRAYYMAWEMIYEYKAMCAEQKERADEQDACCNISTNDIPFILCK